MQLRLALQVVVWIFCLGALLLFGSRLSGKREGFQAAPTVSVVLNAYLDLQGRNPTREELAEAIASLSSGGSTAEDLFKKLSATATVETPPPPPASQEESVASGEAFLSVFGREPSATEAATMAESLRLAQETDYLGFARERRQAVIGSIRDVYFALGRELDMEEAARLAADVAFGSTRLQELYSTMGGEGLWLPHGHGESGAATSPLQSQAPPRPLETPADPSAQRRAGSVVDSAFVDVVGRRPEPEERMYYMDQVALHSNVPPTRQAVGGMISERARAVAQPSASSGSLHLTCKIDRPDLSRLTSGIGVQQEQHLAHGTDTIIDPARTHSAREKQGMELACDTDTRARAQEGRWTMLAAAGDVHPVRPSYT
jgi:hypothetical protein